MKWWSSCKILLKEWKCCPVNSNSDYCVPKFNSFVFSLRRNFISREVWKLIFLLPILFEGYQNMCSFPYLTCLRTFWILKSWHLPFLLYLKCVLSECVWESEEVRNKVHFYFGRTRTGLALPFSLFVLIWLLKAFN